VLKKPCTFSVRGANVAVKGTREQLYTNLPRAFTLLLMRLVRLLRPPFHPYFTQTCPSASAAENESFRTRASRGVRKLLFLLGIVML
jgi:hypothetical protein